LATHAVLPLLADESGADLFALDTDAILGGAR
jgi:hypothetical protein